MSLLKCRQEGLTEKEEEVSEVSSSSDHLNSVESNLDCIELPPYSAIASDRTVAVANTLQQLQGSRVFSGSRPMVRAKHINSFARCTDISNWMEHVLGNPLLPIQFAQIPAQRHTYSPLRTS